MSSNPPAPPQSISPAQRIPTDSLDDRLEEGIALCLSGGGYRAMLFHLGALWRLNDTGYLPRLNRVSSVSGGSITAATLGLAWPRLAFDRNGVAAGFQEHVVRPLRNLAGKTIDIPAALRNLLWGGLGHGPIEAAYRKYLFANYTLQDLPADGEGPRFVINGANLQSGALWRFSRPYMADYRVGKILVPKTELAVAVAVSSAAPPMISPVILSFEESDYARGSGYDLAQKAYRTRVWLTDGGVYDNLGLETAWKRYTTVLVSDGGGKAGPVPSMGHDMLRQMIRVVGVIDNQVRSLRKRQVIESYQLPAGHPLHRDGAYWGTWSHIDDYHLPTALPCPAEQTLRLAAVPTRLRNMPQRLQEQLINWGFAVCDAALRQHVDKTLPAPAGFPYQRTGVG